MYKKIVLLFLTLSLFSCDENEHEIQKNNVQFKIIQKALNNSRVINEVPKSVIISISDNAGNTVIESEQVEVLEFNESYLIEPVLLEMGSYNLTKFLVLNEAEEVIYATPLEDSKLASFVNDPLPISFEILANNATDVFVEVIYTNSIDPEDLGYANFTYEIIPTKEILFSVFGFNSISEKLEFISGDITIYADSDSLYNTLFGDSINVLRLRSDFNSLELNIKAAGFSTKSISLSPDDLNSYRTKPLQVTLINESGLYAYFPFAGNAKEVGNSQSDGQVSGAQLVENMNLVANQAYLFDGMNYYISYGDNFDLGDQDFTISTWVNVAVFEGLKPGTSTRGASIINKGITIYGTPSRSGYGLMAQELDGANMFGFFIGGNNQVFFTRSEGGFLEDTWYNVVGKREGDTISLFVNGELISEINVPEGLNTNTNVPFTFGTTDKLGNDVAGTSYFNGKIDESKIYLKALTNSEIKDLYENGL